MGYDPGNSNWNANDMVLHELLVTKTNLTDSQMLAEYGRLRSKWKV